MNFNEPDLRSGILKCIDSGLDVLGPTAKETVYSYLARNQLERESIPDEPWKFSESLRSLFGRGGEMIEKIILIELRRSFGIGSSDGILVEVLAAMRLPKGPSPKHQEAPKKTRRASSATGPG
jgi:hypothetical protein